jgi:hypothetical protein
VPEILVLAVDAFHRRLDGDVVLGGVIERIAAPADRPLAPRRNDAQLGIERHHRQLEAHLVVALAGGAVRDGVGAFEFGDLDQLLGDQRAGEGGAEQVVALVDGASLHRGEDVVGEKF